MVDFNQAKFTQMTSQQKKIHNSEGYSEFRNQPCGIPLADSKSFLEENFR